MSITPISEAVKAINEAISWEEAEINLIINRINITKEDFMLKDSIKAQNIRFYKQELAVVRKKLFKLKKRKTLITIT